MFLRGSLPPSSQYLAATHVFSASPLEPEAFATFNLADDSVSPNEFVFVWAGDDRRKDPLFPHRSLVPRDLVKAWLPRSSSEGGRLGFVSTSDLGGVGVRRSALRPPTFEEEFQRKGE